MQPHQKSILASTKLTKSKISGFKQVVVADAAGLSITRMQTPKTGFDLISPIIIEPVHEISNNVVCATTKASDQPAHTRSLIKAFASRLSIL